MLFITGHLQEALSFPDSGYLHKIFFPSKYGKALDDGIFIILFQYIPALAFRQVKADFIPEVFHDNSDMYAQIYGLSTKLQICIIS